MHDTLPLVPCANGLGEAALQSLDLSSFRAIWYGLAHGRLRVANTWVVADRCFVALKRMSSAASTGRHAEVAERVFSGEQPKVVAAELGLSPSTVCTHCKSFLELASERPKTPGLAAFIAKAACAARGAPLPGPRFHGLDSEANLVLSIAIPVEPLERAALSRAEKAITAQLVEGKSTVEIGAARGTSTRTLANQIASIYRKLRVSGRRELVAVLLSDSWLPAGAARARHGHDHTALRELGRADAQVPLVPAEH
jgi:DNA-binding CsgD family transcriptional regulator